MSVREILNYFEKQSEDIIWTGEVLQQIENCLSNTRIIHRAVDKPYNKLRGAFVGRRVVPEPGVSILVPLIEMKIFYSSQQSFEYQRLVLCKEMLHCLDDDDVKTAQIDEAIALCDHLTNGEDTIVPQGNSEIQALMDEIAKFRALAILFPMRLRRGFVASFEAKEITLKQISEKVILPEEYVGMVMSDVWPKLYGLLFNNS